MTTSPPALEQIMAAALHCYNTGRFNEAEAACHSLLTHVPRHPAVHQLMALLTLRDQRLDMARKHIVQSLTERPQHGPSLLIAGKIARAENDAGTAARYFEAAAASMPDSSEAYFHLANTLAAQGLHVEAIKHYRQAQTLAPEAMEIALNLGTALRDSGDLEAARECFEKAVVLVPDFAQGWFNLGLTRQDLHDRDGAVAAFRTALTLRPDYADAALNLGVALQEARRMEDALDAYRLAVRLRPENFGRIAHAMTADSTGQLWLSTAQLKHALQVP